MTDSHPIDADRQLTAQIEASTGAAPVETTLRTDERVLARVTDGIYRQPGSAIREVISNAYDADATQVVIKTDRPRFSTISIEDNGAGMSPAAVAHLVRHIGGSAKRTPDGAELGVTSQSDPRMSPGGRRLIGRIGIGLFSIAQLTERFQLITKTRGADHRTVATVTFRHFLDEDLSKGGDFEAGLVRIWQEPASDVDAQGTTIVLTDIRPQTRQTLQSMDIWEGVDADASSTTDSTSDLAPPRFHIGRVDPAAVDTMRGVEGSYDALPWKKGDLPESAFGSLVDAVWNEALRGSPRPQLEKIFDYYLRMVWQLSLAIPAPYVHGHPFDVPFGDSIYAFTLPDNGRQAPTPVELQKLDTLGTILPALSKQREGEDFEVLVDDLRLSRPLQFTDLPTTAHTIRKPIIFAATCREEFANVARENSGGPLEFDAYLMWAPKIVPTEHQGVLIRVHGASGTLFDSTFLRYQVSEQNRLRQISCEIFVRSGLESALNIDRESFNFSHPHVVYLTKWLHLALRRIATVEKRIAKESLSAKREAGEGRAEERLDTIVRDAWTSESDDEGQEPPKVEFIEPYVNGSDEEPSDEREEEAYRFRRSTVFGSSAGPDRRSSGRQSRATERKLRAIIQLLAAYGLIDGLEDGQRDRLAGHIREILEADDE